MKLATLEDVCEVNPKKSEIKLSKGAKVSFVPMVDLSEGYIFFSPKQIKNIEELNNGYTYFKNKDILLAKVTPCFENGKAGIANGLENGIGFGSSEYIVLRCGDSVLPEFIYGIIKSNDFINSGKNRMTGTGGLQRIPTEFVKLYKFPLPDLDVQEKLVSRMEEEEEVIKLNKKLIEMMEKKIKEILYEI